MTPKCKNQKCIYAFKNLHKLFLGRFIYLFLKLGFCKVVFRLKYYGFDRYAKFLCYL